MATLVYDRNHYFGFGLIPKLKPKSVDTFGRYRNPKIQQTKMLVTCQRFGDWFLFGLVWPYSSNQKNIMKVGSKSLLLTCISNITLSLPSYIGSALKRELNFCNGYLSLLYFCFHLSLSPATKSQAVILRQK